MLGRKIKEKRGITLIALVVTIIIMLILVAVTINISVNGGLFEYARKSATEFDESKEIELIEQAKMIAMITNKDAVIKRTELDNALNEVIGENNYTSDATEEGIEITFNGSERTYEIEYDGQVQPEYFYIYKCSDCSVERILITREIEENGYDITQKVSPDRYYSGYYKVYGGSETDVTTLSYNDDNKATDENGEIYDGSSLRNSKSMPFWHRDNAYTEPGNTMNPEKGKVYYLAEVPKAYLKVRAGIVTKPNSNIIMDISVISVVDSTKYQGFNFSLSGVTLTDSVIFAGSYGVFDGNGNYTRITPSDFEGVVRGYIIANNFYSTNPVIPLDLQFTVTPYWTTYDGITVNGQTKTYNTGNDGNGNCTSDTFHEVTD